MLAKIGDFKSQIQREVELRRGLNGRLDLESNLVNV